LNPDTITWDAVIVGTGIGGATLGYALAKAGRRVLFIERGLNLSERGGEVIRGRFAEDSPDFRHLSAAERQQRIALGGRSTDEIRDYHAGFSPYIGCGTGGSSALYGMVMERLFPVDFANSAWPLRYEDLRPWYEAAERLYRVRGEADPLRPNEAESLSPSQPLSPQGAAIFETLARRNMHPYRLHTACEDAPGCHNCQGYLCASRCKNEAAGTCLTPALDRHGASLLTECTALHLEAGAREVRKLICSWRGRQIALRSKTFVLAAGALLTPALLLNSKSTVWPVGLANRSGLVGRYLMRHSIDLYVLIRAPRLSLDAPAKEVAFNDLYDTAAGKLGTVQSFGLAPPLSYLRNRPGLNLWRLLGPAAPLIWNTFSRQPILGAIMEDAPDPENRISPIGSISASGRYQLSLRYRLGPENVLRRTRFRQQLAQILAPFRPYRARGTTDRPALGHACGTCRLGDDPATSVLDPWNRAHGMSNLYVVDASFFPTSGGMNPALTIAANALRVAHHLSTGSSSN
jgi:choline dehydrogenase-like flavoprotein